MSCFSDGINLNQQFAWIRSFVLNYLRHSSPSSLQHGRLVRLPCGSMILVPASIVSLEIPLPSSPDKPAILNSYQLFCTNDPHIVCASFLHRVHSVRSSHRAKFDYIDSVQEHHLSKVPQAFPGKNLSSDLYSNATCLR
jgi:hypothetical protein